GGTGGDLEEGRGAKDFGSTAWSSFCSRNALGLVCLVGRSFWYVWFFWMNFPSDQPDKPDRRDRPDEPAFVGRAQWKINQPPSLGRNEAAWRDGEGVARCPSCSQSPHDEAVVARCAQ